MLFSSKLITGFLLVIQVPLTMSELKKSFFHFKYWSSSSLYIVFDHLTHFQIGGRITPLPLFKIYITKKWVKLVSQSKWLLIKIYLATFIQKSLEIFCISESLRGHRLAAGIFRKLKALDISLILYHWKVFSSLISRKDIRNSNYLI